MTDTVKKVAEAMDALVMKRGGFVDWEDIARAAISAMQEWNFDMSQAPRDGSPVFIPFGAQVHVAFFAPEASSAPPALPDDYYPWGVIDPGVVINACQERYAKAWMPVHLPLSPEGE